MKKCVFNFIFITVLGIAVFADVGEGFGQSSSFRAVDRVNCVFSPKAANDNFVSTADVTDHFHILLPSAGSKTMLQFETFSFETDVSLNRSVITETIPLKGIFKIENQPFGILISGEITVQNPFLGITETLRHATPSLYVEDFFYFKDRPRNPKALRFGADRSPGDRVGGGLTCFLEERFVDQDWKLTSSPKAIRNVREVKGLPVR